VPRDPGRSLLGQGLVSGLGGQLESPCGVARAQRLGRGVRPVARPLVQLAGQRRVATIAGQSRGLEEALLADELCDVGIHEAAVYA